ncbi:TfoX/Sxy family protein [Burkholderia pseudomallei]|uniref:TfoX/Sxy family protein n=1 Tax=Burkholderia pseudomallei TaxID=28450 RepID=UPI0005F2808A|nr:TfoX/Sxy family protein [Burkholderia pseudomallei]KJR91928.1 competence protein TfoX [Burkholderia pseudomallei]MDA5591219.1 TfoX/Sxy family protein [Burkholderia pseudomallei]ONB70423.1 competence protein TfoX [Burkholderia pseudomallei]OND59272.1 competence protein TfoX [Burkholderia pseudomallei]OND62477.1 competence protein TfoX [Burkholderia pseudomallei]
MNWKAEKRRADELAEQLDALGPIGVARFFSGASLRLDGVLFGFVHAGSLFLRVDDDTRAAFERAGMRPFSYSGRTRTVVVGGYYETPADVLEDVGMLRDWCRDAHRAAHRAALRAGAGARRAKRKA